MNFQVKKTNIKDLLVIEPLKITDERGYFIKKYLNSFFKDLRQLDFISEELISRSKLGTIRGLHFQSKNPQAKLINVIKGKVYDVAVDLRKGSLTYGQHYAIELSEVNNLMLLIPEGFAHGFMSLAENSIVSYLCSSEYEPNFDSGLIYNDPDLNIQWPKLDLEYTISDKDKGLPMFRDFKGFIYEINENV